MIKYIAVVGTHGSRRDGDWDQPDSAFNVFVKGYGVEPLVVDPLQRYMWSTMIDGIDSHNDTWDAGGRALAHYIAPPLSEMPLLKPEEIFVIAHSHGGNVVAYACGKYGLQINGLLTIATPIRKDMFAIYEAAAKNIQRHLHLHAGWSDYMQILGSVFDGRFGIHREHPFAKNAPMPGGHGSVLRDSKHFERWIAEGWLEYWKGGITKAEAIEIIESIVDPEPSEAPITIEDTIDVKR